MSKLFCDCKTDEEKGNFFLSGRVVETGVIAPAISNEVAMAFHRCFEFEKQLAAALAAIKDAALQSAISAHGYESGDLHDALAATEQRKRERVISAEMKLEQEETRNEHTR